MKDLSPTLGIFTYYYIQARRTALTAYLTNWELKKYWIIINIFQNFFDSSCQLLKRLFSRSLQIDEFEFLWALPFLCFRLFLNRIQIRVVIYCSQSSLQY